MKSSGLFILVLLLCPILGHGQTYNGVVTINTDENYAAPAIVNAGATVTITSTGSLTCTDLDFVNGNGTLTVESGGYLVVNGTLFRNGSATLTIEHGGSFVTTNTDFTDGSFVSNIVIEKTASATGYSYMTLPITAGNYTDYEYYFSESTHSGGLGSWVNSVDGVAKTVGVGYAIYQEGAVSFTGTPNNAQVGLSLSLTSSGSRSGNAGHHLIGNPYPAAIDMDAFFDLVDNTANTYGSFYIWDQSLNSGNGDYVAITESDGAFVASGQGFFIQLDNGLADGNHTVTIDPSVIVSENNTTFYRKSTYDYSNITLNFSSENDEKNRLSIRLDEEFTDGFDKGFEAYSFSSGNGDVRFQAVHGEKYFDILAIERGKNYSIPLAVTTSKELSVEVELVEKSMLPDSYLIQLVNIATNEVFTINEQEKVSLQVSKLDGQEAFLLKIIDLSNVLNEGIENQLQVYHADGMLNAKFDLKKSQLNSVQVFTLSGQLVKSWQNLHSSKAFSEPFSHTSGLYIVKVETTEGFSSKKIMIK